MRIGHSLSLDEPVMVLRSRLPLGEMFDALSRNNVGPLPQVIQYLWIRAFGESEWVLRAFSALCFGGSVAVAAHWTRRAAGPAAGLLAAVLVATSTNIGIMHGATARPYALLMLIVAAAGWRACARAAAATDADAGAGRLIDPALILLHVAGLLTHHIYVFAAVATIPAAALISRRDAQRAGIAAVIAGAVYLVAWGPVLVQTVALPTTAWMLPPRLVDIMAGYLRLWGFAGALLLAAYVVGFAINARPDPGGAGRVVAACATMAVVPMLLAYLVSAWRPVYFADRTSTLILAPASVLLAIVVAGVRSRVVEVAVAIVLVLSAARFTLTTAASPDPFPARIAMQQLAAQAKCGDAIVIVGLSGPEVDYYARQAHMPACVRRRVLPAEVVAHPGWIDVAALGDGRQIGREADDVVRELSASGVPRLWLIAPAAAVGRELTPHVRLAVEQHYAAVERLAATGSFFDEITEYSRQLLE